MVGESTDPCDPPADPSTPGGPSEDAAIPYVPPLSELRRRRSTKWREATEDGIAAWIADMDLSPPEPVLEALQRYLRAGDLGYPDPTLPRRTREVVAQHLTARDGHSVDPDRIDFLHDAVQGIHLGTVFGSSPGDGVVLTTPLYAPYHEAVAEHGRRPVYVRFSARDRWELELDDLAASLKGWKHPHRRVSVLHLCNPHNPTGRVLDRSELERLAELALRHDLLVVTDEIHADLVYPGKKHIPFASLGPEIADRTLTLTSATKAFNLAAVKLAVVVHGSARLQRRLPSLRSRRFGKPNAFGLIATYTAFSKGRPWLSNVRDHLLRNRDHLLRRLADEAPKLRCLTPEATYLAWIDLTGTSAGEDPAERLRSRHGLVVSNGPDFGPGGQGFIRLNFATSREVLDEGVDRLVQAFG